MPIGDLRVGSGTLNFPASSNDYKGRLSFQVVDEEAHRVQLGGQIKGLFDEGFSEAFSSVVGGIKEGAASFAQGWKQGVGGTSLANPANLNEYAPDINFGKINLYLPSAIRVDDAATYDNNFALGYIGGAVQQGMNQGAGVADAMLKAAGRQAGNITGLISGGGKISNEVAAIVAQNRAKALNEGAGASVSLATGVGTNPNLRTIFRSVPIRQFSFQYTLIPTSQNEAQTIQNIIKKFREELYPEAITAGGIDYAYRFPRRFLIRATYKGGEWDNIRFLPCYLQNFQAVYNPNGMGMHADGHFSEVQISMSFSEARALSKQDVQKGF